MPTPEEQNLTRFGELVDQYTPYYVHFGRFINQFARTELAAHLFFRTQTGMSDEMARAISGGNRMKDIISLTKRLLLAKKIPASEFLELEHLFTQVGVIALLRDVLVHRAPSLEGDEIMTTNHATAKSLESVEVLRVNLRDIQNATEDLYAIFFRLSDLARPEIEIMELEGVREHAAAPWRYKRQQPEIQDRRPGKDVQ